jgi:hypothetical protein
MAGGWSWAGDNNGMQNWHEALLGLALAGWAWILRRRPRARIAMAFRDRRGPILCLALCACCTAALAYHTVQSQLSWGIPTTNPWYAAGALPLFLLLVVGGSYGWPVGRLRFALPLVIGLFYLQIEYSTVLGWMTSLYTAHAEWSTALARLAFLQPPIFGTSTLQAAIGAVLVVSALAIREVLAFVTLDLQSELSESTATLSRGRVAHPTRRGIPHYPQDLITRTQRGAPAT